MSGAECFYDTNVLLYLLSADRAKADRAEALLATGGVISVQVLNEFASVASRKLRMKHSEIREVLTDLRKICRVEALSVEMHDLALRLSERHGFSIYDALIIAAALLAGCTTVYTEDLQHGQIIDRQLSICNPFKVT